MSCQGAANALPATEAVKFPKDAGSLNEPPATGVTAFALTRPRALKNTQSEGHEIPTFNVNIPASTAANMLADAGKYCGRGSADQRKRRLPHVAIE